MKKTIAKFSLVLALISFNLSAFAATYADEVKKYTDTFKGNNFGASNALMGELSWKGISDQKVFDPLLKQYTEKKNNLGDKRSLKEAVTLAKGLSYSGNKKYKAVIEKDLAESDNNKFKKHLSKTIGNFDQYAKWNPVIFKGVAAAKNADKQRVMNMLNADIAELRAMGAKRLMRSYIGDKGLVDLANKRLQATYEAADSKTEVDAAAHLAKALAASGNSEYKATLEKVAADASNKKVRKYAKKFAAQL